MSSISDLFSLDGKVALVTGAATGIGESIAGVLAAAGAHVVVTDIDADGAGKVAAAIGERGYRADAVHLDVTDEASARSGIGQAIAQHGGQGTAAARRYASLPPLRRGQLDAFLQSLSSPPRDDERPELVQARRR